MKINTGQPILNLKGENMKVDDENLTLGNVIANSLLLDTTAGKMKLYILAKKIYDSKSVDLDKADFNIVKNALEKSTTYNALVIGQAELMLNDVKETEEGK